MNKKKFVDPTLPVVVKVKPISRHRKDNFKIIKNHFWNSESAPWGYNYLLGYCEQSSNFAN